MQLHFSVTFACCGNVEILVSTWCETEVVQILKMILGKNFWCADSPGLQVYKSGSLEVCKSAGLQVCKSASLQVCKSASLQVCSLQVSHTVWNVAVTTAASSCELEAKFSFYIIFYNEGSKKYKCSSILILLQLDENPVMSCGKNFWGTKTLGIGIDELKEGGM